MVAVAIELWLLSPCCYGSGGSFGVMVVVVSEL